MASKPVCQYGASCYRKNPDHFKQYSHPGRSERERKAEEEPKEGRKGRRRGGANRLSKDASGPSVQSPPRGKGTITSYFEKQQLPGKRKEKENKDSSAESAGEEGEGGVDEREEKCPPAKRLKQEARAVSPSADIKQRGGGRVVDSDELARESEDVKENVQRKFLVQMPDDFYQFWEFCRSLNSSSPQTALESSVGVVLVGPYDVLSGRLKGVPWEKCVLHSRHYYDPPEMVTVLEAVGDSTRGFHVGYFRDIPGDLADFWLVSNSSEEGCEINIEGRSLFSVLRSLASKKLEEKSLLSSQRKKLTNLLSQLDLESSGLRVSDLPLRELSKQRPKDVVAKCFHKMGIVVPYDRKTELGYRPLPLTDRELWKLLNKIASCSSDKARCDQAFEPLQEIITFVQFANDECDYGMGLELGLDLFCHGNHYFHNVICHLLPLAYDLLHREEYGKIVQEHLRHRNQTPLDYRQ